MKIFVLFIVLFGFMSCSSVPKGEYSRSKIDRPYALPDDVASFDFGLTTTVASTENNDIASEDQDVSYGSYYFGFEQGISNNVSWVYPLGLKWNIYDNEKHTFGYSVYTLILYSTTSFDYWYRINDKFSLRPYFRTRNFDYFIVEEDKQGPGLDLVYQTTEKLAISFGYNWGTFTSSSDFLDVLITGTTQNDEDSPSRVEGEYKTLTLDFLYSVGENWDLNMFLSHEARTTDDFDYTYDVLELGATYFY